MERGGKQDSVLHPGKGEACKTAAGLAGGSGESQGDKGEEEAEDTERNTNVQVETWVVTGNTKDPGIQGKVPTGGHLCHAEAVHHRANYGCRHVEAGEFCREYDEGLLLCLSSFIFLLFTLLLVGIFLLSLLF